MILKIAYKDVEEDYAINSNNSTQMYMRISVNEEDIEEAVERFRDNPFVVGFDYRGKNIELLNKLDTHGKSVFVRIKHNEDVNSLSAFLNALPEFIKVVMTLPENYRDLRKLYEISNGHNNLRFCGGMLLRLPGLKIGCVQPEDISNKDVGFKGFVSSAKCSCIFNFIEYNNETREYIKFSRMPLSNKKKKEKAPKIKVKKEKSERVVRVKKTTSKAGIRKQTIKSMISSNSEFDGF